MDRCPFSDILTSGKIPQLFKRAKVITMLKPEKDVADLSYFRPISLLSIVFKILERMKSQLYWTSFGAGITYKSWFPTQT
jgi:hypothetical protein